MKSVKNLKQNFNMMLNVILLFHVLNRITTLSTNYFENTK
uniref:Uncharacterized protein n=1 Tax=Lepeophtheirus salmonis TaxID=72036 RepID=A0A0K2TA69_LEPSM